MSYDTSPSINVFSYQFTLTSVAPRSITQMYMVIQDIITTSLRVIIYWKLICFDVVICLHFSKQMNISRTHLYSNQLFIYIHRTNSQLTRSNRTNEKMRIRRNSLIVLKGIFHIISLKSVKWKQNNWFQRVIILWMDESRIFQLAIIDFQNLNSGFWRIRRVFLLVILS